MAPTPLNAKTTLIAQAKNAFDNLISVQSVVDLETDFSAEILVPVDLLNVLFYYRSQSTVDVGDDLPDLEVAMDPNAWANFLKSDIGLQLFGSTDGTNWRPDFGTVPFSEGQLLSDHFNKTPADSTPTISNDDQVATHYAYWITALLFGENGIGFTANFEQLTRSVTTKNADFNESLKNLVSVNGGKLPQNDENRNTNRYQTDFVSGDAPREGNHPTALQGPNSNNICYQVISSMLEENGDETKRRLLESLRKISFPNRVTAAIAANADINNFPTEVSGVRVESGTNIPQINAALMNALDLKNLQEHPVDENTIFERFVQDEDAEGAAGLQRYSGKYLISEAEWVGAGNTAETKPNHILIPQVVYDTFKDLASGWNTDHFVPFTEWMDGDSLSILLALASENQAVVNTGVLNSGSSSETHFVPDFSGRRRLQTRNPYFINQDPQTEAIKYQTSQGGDQNTNKPGGLYDKNLSLTNGKLLGWRLANMKLKLSNVLNKEQCIYLALWSQVIAVLNYLELRNKADESLGGATTEDDRNAILKARDRLSRMNWRVDNDEDIALLFIKAELSKIYQSMFRDIDTQYRAPSSPSTPEHIEQLKGNKSDKLKMSKVGKHYLSANVFMGAAVTDIEVQGKLIGNTARENDALALYNYLTDIV
jgi:hypothetical protein